MQSATKSQWLLLAPPRIYGAFEIHSQRYLGLANETPGQTRLLVESGFLIFILFILKQSSKKVALILDNYGLHGENLNDTIEQIEIICLPRNCTSIQKSMDTVIVDSRKDLYWREMLCKIIKDFVSTKNARIAITL